MYATMSQSPAVTASRLLGQARPTVTDVAGLDRLVDQVCAEAGLWAPQAAERALRQARGDVPAAVALVRVWACALPHVAAEPVQARDVHLTRRVTSAYADVPGGQWLGVAPDLAERTLRWDEPDEHRQSDPAGRHEARPEPTLSGPAPGADGEGSGPTRAGTPRVRTLLEGVRIAEPDEPTGTDGLDPAAHALSAPYGRATRLGILARAETASLVCLAVQTLATRREAVLLELTTSEVDIRLPHPQTGVPCPVATVPVVEAEIVLDGEVDGGAGFVLGWGTSLGAVERRAIAIALLDGALTGAAGPAQPGPALSEQEVVNATDASANNGFVDHLRLPHHASFASYLDQARSPGVAS